MVKRSQNELNQLVRIAWELGLAVGNRNPRNEYEVTFNAIAAHLQATGWRLSKGAWSSDIPHSEITWIQNRCSPLFPLSTDYLQTSFQWSELIENAIDQDAPASTVVAYESDADDGSDRQWHVLSRIKASPDGIAECAAFVKPSYAAPFSELESTFIDAMLANLNSFPVQIDETDIGAINGLPKRQREVLERLLKGVSLKEIASELRISPHTVSDYSKALYRHFNVSGRAELAAIFRKTAQLELSHAE